MRWGGLAVAFVGLLGCGANKAATAAIAAGTTVGAAVLARAVANTCYASCAYGTLCDHETGLCVASRPDGRPVVSPQAVDGGLTPDASTGSSDPDDDCGGRCLANEVCVPEGRDLTCVPRPVAVAPGP